MPQNRSLEKDITMESQATKNEESVFCAHCDMPNLADAAYCVDCGAPIHPEAQAAVAAAAQSQPKPTPKPIAPPLAPSTPLTDARQPAGITVAPVASQPAPQAPPVQSAGHLASCGACGITNPAGAVFCVNCGTLLGVPSRIAQFAPSQLGVQTGAASSMSFTQNVYVNNAAYAQPQMQLPVTGPSFLIRAIWFLFIGLWIGQAWLVAAWLLNLTLIGLPLGMWMLNRMPQVMTLRPSPPQPVQQQSLAQSSATFAVRAVYFVLIGWWVSFLWMQLAWLISATIIGLPLAFMMFERVGTLMTLSDS